MIAFLTGRRRFVFFRGMKHFDIASLPALSDSMRRGFHANYLAMYSSIYGGIVTDPVLMMLPIDDHMVHRGDGVFEVFKCVNGGIYNLKAHLERLEHSVSVLDYRLPCPMSEIRSIVLETTRAGKVNDASIHLYVSRGPGSLGVNPYDCPRSELYVVVTRLKNPFMDDHPDGAKVISSSVPPKQPYFASIKSCNYLSNVLMKKEAEEKGADFAVGFDEKGLMTEGATENMGIVTPNARLLFPKLEGVLCGTTMMRVFELAKQLVAGGQIAEVAFADVPKRMVLEAIEMLVVGTTPNVAMVREFDGRAVGYGRPGPVYRSLSKLLVDDIAANKALRTPVFGE
ncbi:MAG: peptidase [Verrucomicrobia bacterium]|nr:peptidase [Verrucomicrobiota bacterium]